MFNILTFDYPDFCQLFQWYVYVKDNQLEQQPLLLKIRFVLDRQSTFVFE
jgi:hypothetical protein